MKVNLPTNSRFLRKSMRNSRIILAGQEVKIIPPKRKKNSGQKNKQKIRSELRFKIFRVFSILFFSISLLLSFVILAPDLYYRLFPADIQPIEALDEGSVLGGDFQEGTAAEEVQELYEPELNPDLPEGKWLIIPRIGVRTQLIETNNPEKALQKGVWLVPDYGQAGSRDLPMILAAHRYGWAWWWKTDYWKYNSFYYLPELEPGDRVEIIWDQRKWVYEIYAGEEGQEITDYQADLILYTCKFLNSPIRHFRYARLVKPEVL